jgi:CrcB protein
MRTAIAVAVGGALGALVRYGLSLALNAPGDGAFPAATFAANIAGSLLIGLLGGRPAIRRLPEAWREFMGTGCLGGFTTLSAFGAETVRLAESGHALMALVYASASIAAGLVAAVSGRALAQAGVRTRRDAT